MGKNWLSAVVVCLLLAGVSTTYAQQQAPPGPPRVLQISHEEIKPDKGPAHEQQAKHYVQLPSKANSPYYRLALLPVTGEENEVLYLWGFDSYAQAEKFGKDSEKWATETLKTVVLARQIRVVLTDSYQQLRRIAPRSIFGSVSEMSLIMRIGKGIPYRYLN
jgi:hypothetical protein